MACRDAKARAPKDKERTVLTIKNRPDKIGPIFFECLLALAIVKTIKRYFTAFGIFRADGYF